MSFLVNEPRWLGRSLLGQQQYAAAQPLLVSGYQGLKQRTDTIPAEDQIRLTGVAGAALRRLGQKDKTDAWRKHLEEQKRTEEKPRR